MNFIEAITYLRDHQEPYMWARPVSWREAHIALCENRGKVEFVPTLRGGIPAPCPSVEDIIGEWEIVDPGEVCKGR